MATAVVSEFMLPHGITEENSSSLHFQ